MMVVVGGRCCESASLAACKVAPVVTTSSIRIIVAGNFSKFSWCVFTIKAPLRLCCRCDFLSFVWVTVSFWRERSCSL